MQKNYSKYKNLINLSKQQVFLFTSNAIMPFSFTRHPWFVVNNKGDISRWEIIVDPNKPDVFVTKDFCDPWLGSAIFPFNNKFYWKERLEGYVTEDENNNIEPLVKLILNSEKEYPFNNLYLYLGPNSNTYAQWILNQYPEFDLKLPWNSFGKGYKNI
jgi:hypothetical protein